MYWNRTPSACVDEDRARALASKGVNVEYSFKQFGVFTLALLMASGSAAAQGYPTQSSPSSTQTQDAPAAQTAPAASSTDDSAPPAKPDKNAPSPTTLKNIDAIGNRNVGCNTGAGNWYSLEKQVAMGQQYSQQVDTA